ncbi:hypothetical protein GCM10028778_17800 [Barrientosiimonas marina]
MTMTHHTSEPHSTGTRAHRTGEPHSTGTRTTNRTAKTLNNHLTHEAILYGKDEPYGSYRTTARRIECDQRQSAYRCDN